MNAIAGASLHVEQKTGHGTALCAKGNHTTASGSATRSQPECGSMKTLRWFVVQTHPKCEKMAVRDLAEKGFTAFLPTVTVRRPMKPRELLSRKMRRETPQTKLVDVPFFPGYLFVQFCRADQDWHDIAYAEGVKSLVPGNIRPHAVPVGEVEMILAGSDDRHKIAQTFPPISVNARLRITEGPFADQTGVCLWSDDARVRVLMLIMNEMRPVEVERSFIRVADPEVV